jgi:diacylglycerol kinase family enzyme
MAGIGIDGAVVAGVREREKRRLGKLAYVLSGVREIWRWDTSMLTVSDGQRSRTCHSVIVANAAHYGGPYRLARQTDIFDAGFELILLDLPARRNLLHYLLRLLMPDRRAEPADWLVQDRSISISGNKKAQLDGDPFGSGSLEIRLIPNFNHLLC